MRNLSIAAMGVYPYHCIYHNAASCAHNPSTAGASERRRGWAQKLNQWTHWLMVPLAMMQGYGQLILFQRGGGLPGRRTNWVDWSRVASYSSDGTIDDSGYSLPCLAGERITENGIGNGISIIMFGGIVAGMPTNMGRVSS